MDQVKHENQEIKAGVTLMARFCRSTHTAFGGYIAYIDREEARRKNAGPAFNLYQDYMGNPEKTSAIFTAAHDSLSKEQMASLKNSFLQAQEDGSNMWQIVISFDNRWLEENHLYDSETGSLDDTGMRTVTRNAVRKMLKCEDMQNALWSAAIHYNTDNIHVHIAVVDPYLSRKKKEFTFTRPDGSTYTRTEYVGRFKLQTIKAGKSSVVNDILKSQETNQLINDLIRNHIVKDKRDTKLSEDPNLQELFLRIYEQLPENPNLWIYNMNVMAGLRPDLDQLTDQYIRKYHEEDYQQLIHTMYEQSVGYQKAYGNSGTGSAYVQSRLDDLHARMGNAILQEMKQLYYSQRHESVQQRDSNFHKSAQHKTGTLRKIHAIQSTSKFISDREFQQAFYQMKKSLRKTFEEILNEQKYEEIQEQQIDELTGAQLRNQYDKSQF